MTATDFAKYARTAAEVVVGLVAFLATLAKIKPIENWLDAKSKTWLTQRPEGYAVRRFDQAELDRIEGGTRTEIDSICMAIRGEYHAHRVSVIQYEKQPDGSRNGTCLGESREEDMYSVRHSFKNTPAPSEMWAEIERVHKRKGRYLYVPDANLLDREVLRVAMLRAQTVTAYYQTLPDADGNCGALLSISWREPTELNVEKLGQLQLSARFLGGMLREHWHLKPDAN